jgi:soluble lytic murein transglycosylase-like protein
MTRAMHDRDAASSSERRTARVVFARGVLQALMALCALFVCTSAAVASCWEAAGARYRIHPWLLAAIAKVESGFDPAAVNATHAQRTGSVDLGLMQINSQWLPVLARHGISRDALFEPCTNVNVGAWILAGLFARYGVTWEAVGAYNAGCARLEPRRCAALRASYARKVDAALRGLTLASTGPAPGGPSRILHVSLPPLAAARAAGAQE